MPSPTQAQVIEFLSDCSPDELDEIIEELQERLGLERLAAPVPDWLATMGEPLDMGMPAGYEVVLLSGGAARVQVMKALRASLGVDLRKAKELVHDCPSVVGVDLDREQAEALSEALRAAGAEVEVR